MTNGRTLERSPERRGRSGGGAGKACGFRLGALAEEVRVCAERATPQADFFCRVRNRSLCFPKTLSCPVKAPGGRCVTGWCFVPSAYLVAGDVMLAQKIALETDEKAALNLLIAFHCRRPTGQRKFAGVAAVLDRDLYPAWETSTVIEAPIEREPEQ